MSITKRKSLHGPMAFVSDREQIVGRGGLASGGLGIPGIAHVGAMTTGFIDDFRGLPIGDTGAFVTGTSIWQQHNVDTGQVPNGLAASAPAVTNGVFRFTMSASATQTAAGTSRTLTHQLAYKANQGRLRIAARLNLSVLAGSQVFVGFTDNAAGEFPAYDTGGGVISQAADCVGWLFGQENQGTAAVWQGVAVKSTPNDSGDLLLTTTARPTVGVYDVLEIVMDSNPNPANSYGIVANFFLNGRSMGQIQAPVLETTAMTPVVAVCTTDAQALVVDLDWVAVSAQRDTGT